MRKIGLHVRMQEGITEVIEKALRLELPFFQNFLITQQTGRHIRLTDDEKKAFLSLRRAHFNDLYVHGSYLINGACVNRYQEQLLKKELLLAEQLEFTHYVFHPGSARDCVRREDGIDNLARVLNSTVRRFPSVKIVLENTAHGNKSIGSDLDDFVVLLEKIDTPESIAFCIDTAHAHAYGYDLRQGQQQRLFDAIKQLGIERIALIHLNDAREKQGSKVDCHKAIGAGSIGEAALQEFFRQPLLAHIPVLMELPTMTEEQELHELEKVRKW